VSRVAVVGLGLIGGSLALAARALGHDRDAGVRQRARRKGIEALDSLEAAIEDAEVVVTAVSTAETPALLREISAVAPRAVLTDTASLKMPMVLAAQTLRAGVRFVAGHPLAGSRREGIEAASAELFAGRPWILVPTARSDEAAIAAVTDLVDAVGARAILLDAERHDRLMTWISHLPLAVATSLMRAAAAEAGPDLAALAGPGFLDTTRIAGQRLELALELALADPDALARSIDAVRSELSRLATALRDRDERALSHFFEEAVAARRDLDAFPDPKRS
jgi:prephenate dehydrogenase